LKVNYDTSDVVGDYVDASDDANNDAMNLIRNNLGFI
jgi:hypothetical protein